MKIAIKMTGCRNNRYELDQILTWAIKNKVPVVREEEADYCIINTCTVTSMADKKSRQMVRSTKHAHPALKTIVFGCAARMQKEAFKKVAEADHLLSDLPDVIGFLEEQIGPLRKCDWPGATHSEDFTRSRALVQIQDGCDSYCTYCIIAPARGGSKNRPQKEIIEEIKDHVAHGFNEVVLTGINIGAYGASKTTKPEENKFAELLELILKETDIKRIRISSLGPEFFNEKWFKILKNKRICRHIHLSIQSGSSSVLKRMKRNYNAPLVMKIIKRLQKEIPGIAITSDIIVGFPEETNKEFEETLKFVKKAKLAKVHVFPYSQRQNTLAAKMKQVPVEVRKERAKVLQKIADDLRQDFIKSQIGKKAEVLWERKIGKFCEGTTDNYIKVKVEGECDIRCINEQVLRREIIKME